MKVAKDSEKTSEDRKQCFVIGPIGSDGTEIRDEADWFLWMITPVLEEFGFEVKRADQLSEPGLISEQVINMAIDADLAVADLTDYNANAFYELAIRHGTGKPVIHMIRADQRPPFDVADFRAIQYSRQRPSMLEKAQKDLRGQVEAVMKPDYKGGNPVTRAQGAKQLLASGDDKDQMVAALRNDVHELKNRIASLEDLPSGVIERGRYNVRTFIPAEVPFPPPPRYGSTLITGRGKGGSVRVEKTNKREDNSDDDGSD